MLSKNARVGGSPIECLTGWWWCMPLIQAIKKYRHLSLRSACFYRASSRIVSETRATIPQEPKENKRQKRIFG